MKIGIGTTVMTRGIAQSGIDGIGQYTSNLIDEFSNLDLDIIKTNFYEKFYKKDFDSNDNFNINKYNLLASKFNIETDIMRTFQDKVSLFHAMDYYIPNFSKIPVISTVMDTIPLSNPEWISQSLLNKLKIRLWKSAIESTNHTITISNFSKLEILKHTNISEKNISVIPLGINPIFKNYSKETLSLDKIKAFKIPKNFFLSVGTIQPRKNFENLIEAHLCLPDSYREAYPLIIVGRYGWGCKKLYHDLKYKKNEHIYWLNYVDEKTLVTLMKNCYALVIPSLFEGFGLPLLEGFASKVPVIASSSSSLSEIGKNYFIGVDSKNHRDISFAMQNIVDNKSSYDQLVSKAFLYSKKFLWSKAAKETIKVYKKYL
tara:strand:- start:2005 stop:3123 length:1119 start_codon:yes stop_codon:yes gene_type:complete